MRPFVENLPYLCIILAILGGIVSPVLPSGRAAYRATVGISGVVTALSAVTLRYVYLGELSYVFNMGRFPAPFGNAIKVGPLQALLVTVFAGVMLMSLLGGRRDLFHDVLPDKLKYYCTMVNMILASLLALTYTNDLFTGYVFIEISTIAACALVMAKDDGANLIATIRYLFMSLLGSGLFLISIILLLTIGGYLLMPSLTEAVAALRVSGRYDLALTVCAGLMMVGLGVKSAMFPFHTWLPGAHGGATTSSSAILSGLVLKGYIVLMMTMMVRVFTLELMVELGITDVLLVFGLLGMIVGSLYAMREHHIKRMLAYSSVAQVGYIFMGLGMGTGAGVVAACFHMMVHACCKPLLFACAGRLSAVTGHHKDLRDLRGSAYRDLVAGVGFTVGALSMIGIPLFGGFVSKLYLASAAVPAMHTALILLVIALSTVLNALYYVPALLAIWVRPSQAEETELLADVEPEPSDRVFQIGAAALILGVLALGILYHPITEILVMGIELM